MLQVHFDEVLHASGKIINIFLPDDQTKQQKASSQQFILPSAWDIMTFLVKGHFYEFVGGLGLSI